MINEDAGIIPAELLKGMLEGLSDGIVLTDNQEQVTFINKSAVRILGCREQIDEQDQITFSEICSLLNLRTGQRYASPLEQVINEKEDEILLVSHSAVIRGLMTYLAGIPFEDMMQFKIPNLSVYEVDSDEINRCIQQGK